MSTLLQKLKTFKGHIIKIIRSIQPYIEEFKFTVNILYMTLSRSTKVTDVLLPPIYEELCCIMFFFKLAVSLLWTYSIIDNHGRLEATDLFIQNHNS